MHTVQTLTPLILKLSNYSVIFVLIRGICIRKTNRLQIVLYGEIDCQPSWEKIQVGKCWEGFTMSIFHLELSSGYIYNGDTFF